MNRAYHRYQDTDRLRSWQAPGARPRLAVIEEARRGLLNPPRSMPSRYSFDARGSQLFDAICASPEHYLTRSETELLAQHAPEIIDLARPAQIVDFGGSPVGKTRHLLDACGARHQTCAYWPFDVRAEAMLESGQALVNDYHWLGVNALIGDYQSGLMHLPDMPGRRLFLLLGGAIGDFTLSRAIRFLVNLRLAMRPGDWLLIGADRVKDPEVFHAACNDSAGLVAQFNLNLLNVLNRELEADFNPDAFRHEAYYDSDFSQVEMYLGAAAPQRVRLGALQQTIALERGERILTQISRKFTRAMLQGIFQAVRFTEVRHYEPDNGHYSLALLRL